MKPEALRAKVLADLAARSDAAGIIATAPAPGAGIPAPSVHTAETGPEADVQGTGTPTWSTA